MCYQGKGQGPKGQYNSFFQHLLWECILFKKLHLSYLGFPRERWPDQLYVAVISESPHKELWTAINAPKYNGFFNLTMTYRHDSDILYAHFLVEPLHNTIQEQEKQWELLKVL